MRTVCITYVRRLDNTLNALFSSSWPRRPLSRLRRVYRRGCRPPRARGTVVAVRRFPRGNRETSYYQIITTMSWRARPLLLLLTTADRRARVHWRRRERFDLSFSVHSLSHSLSPTVIAPRYRRRWLTHRVITRTPATPMTKTRNPTTTTTTRRRKSNAHGLGEQTPPITMLLLYTVCYCSRARRRRS